MKFYIFCPEKNLLCRGLTLSISPPNGVTKHYFAVFGSNI